MKKISRITKTAIDEIVGLIKEDKELRFTLPGGGKLSMDRPLPFLLIYRRKKDVTDPATVRFALSESSYLIIGADGDLEAYKKLIFHLGKTLAAKFKSCLLFEFWAGELKSNKFVIKGPKQKSPSTTDVLMEKLKALTAVFPRLDLAQEIDHIEERHPDWAEALLSAEDIKRTGTMALGLEIPPVYISEEGEMYPVFFRGFHDKIVELFRVSIYEFIRVQTSAGVGSYKALGRGSIDDAVWHIDQKLADIEYSYRFLLLVAPSNIKEIRKNFFESKFQKLPEYHYRLLPIDPDILKRELYNLRLEDIEDPAIAFLFRDKREELDRQITMLNERGTKDFFYNSIRLYKGLDHGLQETALEILQEVPEKEEPVESEAVSAQEFRQMAEMEFEYLRKQYPAFDGKIHVRDDVNVMMVSQGELFIPEETQIPKAEAEALIQHEVGTHVLTYWNGRAQPFRQLACGFADYDSLQEGLAVMAEYLVGGLTANRLRMLAGRVEAAAALVDGGDFVEVFRLLHKGHGFSEDRAFNITSRIFQGGGFIKDIIYLRGLTALCKHLRNGGELEPLLIGKIAVKHIDVMHELRERQVLREMPARPKYLEKQEARSRLQRVREGLSLPQMVNA